MLGELLAEERGKATGFRVISPEGPKLEISFRAGGKMTGVDVIDIGTYWSVPKPGGFMYGEGQGVLLTADGEMATWSAHGIGKFKPGGGASWRGAGYYETASQKLARIHGAVAVFEFETDAEDNTVSKIWEWK